MSRHKVCIIDGCDRNCKSRQGWCSMHARRHKRTGDPLKLNVYADSEAAFAARQAIDGDCVVWTGFINPDGYGKLGGRDIEQLAHRYAWVRVNGPIPNGLVVDHICRNRRCIKVEHLRVVTQIQNLQHRSVTSTRAKSGFRGVSPFGNKWKAAVGFGGEKIYLGLHPSIEEAVAAVVAKRIELQTHNDLDRAYVAGLPNSAWRVPQADVDNYRKPRAA